MQNTQIVPPKIEIKEVEHSRRRKQIGRVLLIFAALSAITFVGFVVSETFLGFHSDPVLKWGTLAAAIAFNVLRGILLPPYKTKSEDSENPPVLW